MSAVEEQVSQDVERETAAPPIVGELISRAEIETGHALAMARPRSITEFMRTALDLATMNEEIADECIFAKPQRMKDPSTGRWVDGFIEGPSVRLAEIITFAWRNTRQAGLVVNRDPSLPYLVARGVYYDLETNNVIAIDVDRSVVTKDGERFSANLITQNANAAVSIAMRNACFKIIPRALWWQVYQAARKVVAGDSKTLVARRDQALELLTKVGVSYERVLARMRVKGLADIGLDEIVTLKGLHNAIRDGEITAEEAFPLLQDSDQTQPPAGATKTAQVKEALKASVGKPANGNKGSQAADAPKGKLPFYDEKSALARLQECAGNVQALDDAHTEIWRDFKDTKRVIPQSVEASYSELRESAAERQGMQE